WGNAYAGWGPTVREVDYLTRLFDEVVHLAPFHPGKAPGSALPYQSSNITLRAVPVAGGEGFVSKLNLLLKTPIYLHAILREMHRADVVHIRCPANISLLAVILLAFIRRPRLRWIKYAGNWRPENHDSWSYRLEQALASRRCHD
ncbi:MAG: hypothetical protein M3362_18695, partial [Acidobacteriota bacterium]|nr:hypothetical protein [Acidobacteriota bacterium]